MIDALSHNSSKDGWLVGWLVGWFKFKGTFSRNRLYHVWAYKIHIA